MKMMGIERRRTTPYHSQNNGMVERLNGTLKSMIKKLSNDRTEDWDEMIPGVLFSYREIPNNTTGFSPFTLMYGRDVRGPTDILADMAAGKLDIAEEYTTVHRYAQELKESITKTNAIAKKNTQIETDKVRRKRNHNPIVREFKKNDEVLVLLPKDGNALFMTYQGPFTVIARRENNNYLIDVKGTQRMYHANLMKRYFRMRNKICDNRERMSSYCFRC